MLTLIHPLSLLLIIASKGVVAVKLFAASCLPLTLPFYPLSSPCQPFVLITTPFFILFFTLSDRGRDRATDGNLFNTYIYILFIVKLLLICSFLFSSLTKHHRFFQKWCPTVCHIHT